MKNQEPLKPIKPNLQLVQKAEDFKSQAYLLHPVVDPLMMGGLSLVFFVAMHFFVDPSASTYKLSWVMFVMSMVVNFPHFMASYVLMYRDYRKEILSNWKFTWAGLIAPVALGTSMAAFTYYSVSTGSHKTLGYLPSLMYLLVGHHYVKQIYGCVMVSSAKAKFYFSPLESKALWVTMYSVWMMSFLSFNSYTVNTHNFYGISYSTLGLGKIWLTLVNLATAVSVVAFLATMVKRYVTDGRIMPLSAWTAIVSIFVWYIPSFYHQHYFYMIPFFHSLQYLLFSSVFAKNKALDLSRVHEDGPRQRASFLKNLGTFFGLTIVTGLLAWHYIPSHLDSLGLVSNVLGPTFFMFSFQIFLNIHHYIMDNVLWRKENLQIKKYL
ncbi:MAG TPA: hypothetical protein VNJ01_15100 [Bacteriovoracaceae bacterium]|nr:hypothetical protein [Bacteriovoracaceae bacterium]